MVEADPDLLARAEQFRQAAAEVASPVAEAGREESIAQALESFRPAKAKSSKLSTWLGQRNWKMPRLRLPSQDRLRNPKLVPIFSVAAVLVVVFLAISIIVLLGDDTSDDDSEAMAPATTSAAIQASEFDQFLESAEFQAAADEILDGILDEMSATPAALATSTTAPQSAAPRSASLSDGFAADDDASTDEGASAASAFVAPAAEGRASDTEETEAENSGPAELADAAISTSTGECLTEGGVEALSDEDISAEGELEDTDEEPEPGDPDAIERSGSPSFDDRPATELEVPEPPSVRPSPPAESSAVSSNTIPSDFEDAPLLEC